MMSPFSCYCLVAPICMKIFKKLLLFFSFWESFFSFSFYYYRKKFSMNQCRFQKTKFRCDFTSDTKIRVLQWEWETSKDADTSAATIPDRWRTESNTAHRWRRQTNAEMPLKTTAPLESQGMPTITSQESIMPAQLDSLSTTHFANVGLTIESKCRCCMSSWYQFLNLNHKRVHGSICNFKWF